ncbi:MAG: hypothetical protein R3A79_15800 [Nannocystaceae bacterium]
MEVNFSADELQFGVTEVHGGQVGWVIRVIQDEEKLNAFIGMLSFARLSSWIEWYRGELRDRAELGEYTSRHLALLDHVDELLEHAAQAKLVLAQGVDEHWGPLVSGRLERACDDAEAEGLEVGRFRLLVWRIHIALSELEIDRVVEELGWGERSPEELDRLDEIEHLLERFEDEGLDVTEARNALHRAHYVASCWRRGVDPDTEDEDDGPVDEKSQATLDPRPDTPVEVPAAEERSALPSLARGPVARAEVVAEADHFSEQHRAQVRRDPGRRGRALVEGYLRRAAVRLGVGVGATTLRDIVWGLLALDRTACVPVDGQQLVLVEHLREHGALRGEPCERAARAALRKLVKHTPIGQKLARTRWRYRLDQLWAPTPEFLEAFAASEAAE